MTGYGRGECAQNGFKATVELSSVNRKQTEITVYLPRELEALESQTRDEINRVVARGRVTARIELHTSEGGSLQFLRVNATLAKTYVQEMRQLARTLNLSDAISLDLVARAPGVVESSTDMIQPDRFWPAIEKALRQALATLIKMREREGANLARDLSQRIETLRKAAARVEKRAPQIAKRFKQQLEDRLKSAGLKEVDFKDPRLVQELVLFADRTDISEELTRLKSHFQQFNDCLKSREPVGRTLDFLAQEMNREINTIGSKANDSMISREVVILKTELEKFREQVQNVE